MYEKADCLEDAISMYEKAEDYEAAAKIYETLEKYREAGEYYLKAADATSDEVEKTRLKELGSDDFAKQAELLEESGEYALASEYWEKAANSTSDEEKEKKLELSSLQFKAERIEQKIEAIHSAALHMVDVTKEITEELGAKGINGPNLDTYYWYRIWAVKRTTMSGEIEGEKETAVTATILPLPARDFESLKGTYSKKFDELPELELEKIRSNVVSEDELDVFFYLNTLGRVKAADETGIKITLKHFPGGRPDLGDTHSEVITCKESLDELENIYAKPFLPWLAGPNSEINCVMMGHEIWENAEKELKEKYPEIKSIAPDFAMPASLSPYFIRGYLRNELKFDGMVVADAYEMNGLIASGVGNLQGPTIADNFPSELSSLGTKGVLFVCAVYAGVNSTCFELGSGENMLNSNAKEDFEVIKNYYESNDEFKELFEGQVLENMIFLMKKLDDKKITDYFEGISILDINSGSLSGEKAEKIQKLKDYLETLTFEQKMPFAVLLKSGNILSNRSNTIVKCLDAIGIQKSEKEVNVSQYTTSDIWNRGGLLDIEFRKTIMGFDISETKTETNLSNTVLKDDKRLESSLGKENDLDAITSALTTLNNDEKFVDAYYSQNWNSEEWKAAFSAFYKKLVNGDYPDLTP